MQTRAVGEEILIIGAGVAGLGVGWQLAKRGHAVTILERGEHAAAPGSGCRDARAHSRSAL